MNVWGYGYRVGNGQDPATRYSQATANNPSITSATQADADTANELAMDYVTANSVATPYNVTASGTRSGVGETATFTLSVQVVQESPEEG